MIQCKLCGAPLKEENMRLIDCQVEEIAQSVIMFGFSMAIVVMVFIKFDQWSEKSDSPNEVR